MTSTIIVTHVTGTGSFTVPSSYTQSLLLTLMKTTSGVKYLLKVGSAGPGGTLIYPGAPYMLRCDVTSGPVPSPDEMNAAVYSYWAGKPDETPPVNTDGKPPVIRDGQVGSGDTATTPTGDAKQKKSA